MSKKQSNFDPNSAFKSIVGVEQGTKEAEPRVALLEKRESEFIISAQEKKEARSKRVNLLIKPSIHAKVIKKCESMGISLNECVNQFLEKWINQ